MFNRKSIIAASHDIFMAATSFVLSLYLRLGNDFHIASEFVVPGTIAFTCICAVVFSGLRLYQGVWRYASAQDLIAITKAVTLAMLIFLPVMFMYNRLEGLPRSVFFINWFVLLALLGGPRFFYRVLRDKGMSFPMLGVQNDKRITVLLAGVDDNTEHFLRESARKQFSDYRVVGIVDNDPQKIGRYIHNVKVHGDCSKVSEVISELRTKGKAPQKILIASHFLGGAVVRDIVSNAENLGLSVARLPRITEFKQERLDGATSIQPIALEDLLGRPQTALDKQAMRSLIQGKRILITGSGGTIGSELTRQIAAYGPSSITMMDNSEYNLYQIDHEIASHYPELVRKALLADIRDQKSLLQHFMQEKPDIVFHAAALKHVPLLEQEENAVEAVKTNVLGTKQVADCALQAGAKGFVLISTDKAVEPTSIMGATKRLAEQYITALGKHAGSGQTKFSIVRFGNVLGSSGSVIPLFQQQLAAGGPITITDPTITRYFMTIREAVELVLQASVVGMQPNTASGELFVLDMGEPVRIVDLAEQMVRLAGLRPYEDIAIEVTGLRPGEKLHESLFYPFEKAVATSGAGILRATQEHIWPLQEYDKRLQSLIASIIKQPPAIVQKHIRELVAERWTQPVKEETLT